MRRIVVVLVLGLVAGVWPAARGAAHGPALAQARPAGSLQADFNNDGIDDLAVGVPLDTVGAAVGAGAVNVFYGSATGLGGTGSQLFSQATPGVPGSAETDDGFGSALATGDFNNDTFADLAVGAPGESVGAAVAAGAVNVLYGSATGLTGTGSQLFTQVGGAVEAGDQFGSALAAGDFDNDAAADLAAAAPFESVAGTVDAGAVSVLPGSAAGLTAAGGALFTQVGGAVETGDLFGFAVAAGDFDGDAFADLAVGAPDEDVGGTVDAGAVSVLSGSAGGLTTAGGALFTQVGSQAEPFDLFGFALAPGDFDNDTFVDLAASAPFESVGSTVDAGAVSVLAGSAAGLTAAGGQLFTQVGGAVEAGDLFGFAVGAGDVNGDAFADLAAGAPAERVGNTADAGAVSVLPGSAGGLSAAGGQLFTQVGGAVETGDSFGSALATGDFDGDAFADLAAGAPFENVGSVDDAGAVSVLPGSAGGLTAAGGQLFTQDSPGVPGTAQELDLFGSTLATGDPGPAPAPTTAPGAGSRVPAAAQVPLVNARGPVTGRR
jgi:FG-GAP repeat